MIFIVQISSKCGQGEEGVKNPKILQMSLIDAPLPYVRPIKVTLTWLMSGVLVVTVVVPEVSVAPVVIPVVSTVAYPGDWE